MLMEYWSRYFSAIYLNQIKNIWTAKKWPTKQKQKGSENHI